MSYNRVECLENLRTVSDCEVVLVTPHNLDEFILAEEPLHPAYQYLSETHKADYLRTYFMHFYGGGYSDIKKTTGSWKDSFAKINTDENIWICGYAEIPGGVAYEPLSSNWNELVGNCAYICKPRTPLTTEWYGDMLRLLDDKHERLKQYPSSHPQDSFGSWSNYPIEWNEMLGRIFHRVSYTYKDHLANTLPCSIFDDYR